MPLGLSVYERERREKMSLGAEKELLTLGSHSICEVGLVQGCQLSALSRSAWQLRSC